MNNSQYRTNLVAAGYKQFSNRRLIIGECVTDFVTDLKKLSDYIGNDSKDYVKYAFVSGLPKKVQSSMQSLENFRSMDLEALVAIARVQVQNENDALNEMACASTHVHRYLDDEDSSTRRCFDCGKPGDLRKTCPLCRKYPLCSKLGSKKLARETLICGVSDIPLKQTPLPTIEIIINNRSARGLLDIGCSQNIVRLDILIYDTTRRRAKRQYK
ncbi:hypothetical protein GJ496_004322 [Pomphorhynchus laevis]|nr:hypothetical protein GJ496_004322 [Pomphorhynchus laevis]